MGAGDGADCQRWRQERFTRFWVRAFKCGSPDKAKALCINIMTMAREVQSGWMPKRGTATSLLSCTSSAGSTASGLSVGAAPPQQQSARPALGDMGNVPVMAAKPAVVKQRSAGIFGAAPLERAHMQLMSKRSNESLNLDDYINVMEV